MEISFERINTVVLSTLSIDDNDRLMTKLGEWFWKFLNSNQLEMSLHVPKFDIEIIPISYEYIRLVNLCHYLVQKSKIKNYNNLALFNIFEYRRKRGNINNSLNFKKEYNGNYYFGDEEILITEDRFVPLFKSEELNVASIYQLDAIFNSFKLFKVIAEFGLINQPILIELCENNCLSIINSDLEAKNYINDCHINYNNRLSEEDIIKIRRKYYVDMHSQIKIEYPYHRNIDSRLNVAKDKKVRLSFYNRFFHEEIEDNEIVLLLSEIEENKSKIIVPNIEIFETNHSLDIFEILEKFRDNWKSYDFNKYTTPFPKYWFMFIHKGISINDWKRMFRQNYPNLIHKPIINEIDIILEYLYELDWLKDFITYNTESVFMIPEFSGAKNKYLYEIIVSLRSYLSSMSLGVTFVKCINDFENINRKLFILNGFNVLDIINNNSELSNCNYSYLFPDFLFFCTQPWFKYHVLLYQTDSLLSNLRKKIDENYLLNKSYCEGVLGECIKEAKTNIENYKQKYFIEEAVIFREQEVYHQDDLILNNDEEVDFKVINQKIEKSRKVLITTETGEEFSLMSGSRILLQRNTIINSTAKNLYSGDCFIPYSYINKMVKNNGLIDKLNRISKRVENFQSVLYEKENVYNTLIERGLSHRDEAYFNKHYLISKENLGIDAFRLPKKKNDWKIICNYIGINYDDALQTWVVYYGRKYFSELKVLYEDVLNLLINKEYLGKYEDAEIYMEVSKIIKERKLLFNTEENYSCEEMAKYIIKFLVNEVLLYQVKYINKVNNNG